MSIAGKLKQADIFHDLSADQIEKIVSICEERRFGMGEIIFEENTASDKLYIITQGEVEILVDPALVSDGLENPSRISTIATLRRGQSFGEIALVDQGLRSATARSSTSDTRLLHIPRNQLMAICDQDSSFGFRLMHNLAADLALKIRSTDLLIREKLLYALQPSKEISS